MRTPYISLLAAGALALGGCAYGDLGYGGGYGGYYGGYGPYGGYGYGGSSISIGYSNGYYSPYGYGYGGYGSPYYGWYDNFYYPGTGYYVYDTYRRPHRMTSRQHSYWSRRSPALRTSSTTRVRANWSGFDHRTSSRHRRRDD
jgi:hypothetical protein